LESILRELSESDQNVANRLIFIGKTPEDPIASLNDCIASIYSSHIKRCLAEINRHIRQGGANLPESLLHRRVEMKKALLTPPQVKVALDAAVDLTVDFPMGNFDESV
jgi:hypothetical protein